jgi:hypothetical protein
MPSSENWCRTIAMEYDGRAELRFVLPRIPLVVPHPRAVKASESHRHRRVGSGIDP